jgi:putative transposase
VRQGCGRKAECVHRVVGCLSCHAPLASVAGGIYHVTARGNRQQVTYVDDRDRLLFLELFERVAERRHWETYAYCLMPNHYHLVVMTPEPNLSRGIQLVNSAYAQRFNKRYGLTGHLFQGRFHSVLVASHRHLLELSRYLAQNPVRAGLCAQPSDWPWSSCRSLLGAARGPNFLVAERVLEHFGTDPVRAQKAFHRFVHEPVPKRPGS